MGTVELDALEDLDLTLLARAYLEAVERRCTRLSTWFRKRLQDRPAFDDLLQDAAAQAVEG